MNGGQFDDAVAWAAGWLGIDTGRPMPKPDTARAVELERDRERKHADAAAQEAREAADRVVRAVWLWSQRKPLTGTVGAQYLAGRGIAEPTEGWPDCVAFLPANSVTFEDKNAEGREVKRTLACAGAVIVAATDANGMIHGDATNLCWH